MAIQQEGTPHKATSKPVEDNKKPVSVVSDGGTVASPTTERRPPTIPDDIKKTPPGGDGYSPDPGIKDSPGAGGVIDPGIKQTPGGSDPQPPGDSTTVVKRRKRATPGLGDTQETITIPVKGDQGTEVTPQSERARLRIESKLTANEYLLNPPAKPSDAGGDIKVADRLLDGVVASIEDGVARVEVAGGYKYYTKIDGEWVHTDAKGTPIAIARMEANLQNYSKALKEYNNGISDYQNKIAEYSAGGFTAKEIEKLNKLREELLSQAESLNKNVASLSDVAELMEKAQSELSGLGLLDAVKAGISTSILLYAGYAPADIKAAVEYNQGLISLEDYKIVTPLDPRVEQQLIRLFAKGGSGDEINIEPTVSYDIVQAIIDGKIPESRLVAVYGADALKEAKELAVRVVAQGELKEFANAAGDINIFAALAGGGRDKLIIAFQWTEEDLKSYDELQKYYDKDTDNLDVIQAVKDGVKDEVILSIFSGEDLAKWKEELRIAREVYPSQSDRPGTDDLNFFEAVSQLSKEGKLWPWQQDWSEYNWEDAARDIAQGADQFPVTAGIVQPLVPLFDPLWNELKDRPKSDPMRQAYLSNWHQNLIVSTSTVATLATPIVWKGAGSLTKTIFPAFLNRIPIVKTIPKAAATLAQAVIVVTPVAVSTAAFVEGMKNNDLDRKWDVLSALPDVEKDLKAKLAGYDKSFSQLTDAEKGNVLIHYSVPFDYTIKEWQDVLADKSVDLLEQADKGVSWLAERTPKPIQNVGNFMIGLPVGVLEGVVYGAMIPVISANLVGKMPLGTSKKFAGEVGAGMVSFFTEEIPKAYALNPQLTAGRLVGLFAITPKAFMKYAKGIGVSLDLMRYIPERAIALEYSTVKIAPHGLSKSQMISLITQLNKQLLENKMTTARVEMAGGIFEVKNTAYQQVVGGTVFHFTPDVNVFKKPGKYGSFHVNKDLSITLLNKKGSTDFFYTSPQAAARFGVTSATKGLKMKNPGVIEIHLDAGTVEKFAPTKTMKGNLGELEVPLRGVTIKPVKGAMGKGKSYNEYMGAYSINRYTIEGATTWKGPSISQVLQIRRAATYARMGDALFAWKGRLEALKKITKTEIVKDKKGEIVKKYGSKYVLNFLKDPKLTTVDNAIKQLKKEQPELTGAGGEILRQRQPVPHPKTGGLMNPRVTGIVRHPKTNGILLVQDKIETPTGAYGLPGGRIELAWWRQRPKKGHTWESAVNNQLDSEVNFVAKEHQYLGIYLGKVNEYALSGSRVFDSVAVWGKEHLAGGNGKINRWEATKRTQPPGTWSKPEINDAFWWDGKSEITVFPATFDILNSVAKKYNLNMGKVKKYKTNEILNKNRDVDFAQRVARGERIPETNLKAMNRIEIQNLSRLRAEILRGEPAGLKDTLFAEWDFTQLAEFINGRQKAFKYSQNGSLKAMPAEMVKTIRDAGFGEKYTKLTKEIEIMEKANRDRLGEQGSISLENTRGGSAEYKLIVERYKKLKQELYELYEKAFDKIIEESGELYDVYRRAALNGEYRGLARALSKIPYRYYMRNNQVRQYVPVVSRMDGRRAAATRRATGRLPDRYRADTRIPRAYRGMEMLSRVQPRRVGEPGRPAPRRAPPPGRTPPPDRVPPPPRPAPVEKAGPKRLALAYDKIRKDMIHPKGAIAFRMGKVNDLDKWYVVKWPYQTIADVTLYLSEDPPPGVKDVKDGLRSAYKSIQLITGKAPRYLTLDEGAFDIIVRSPAGKGSPSINFKVDRKGKTKSNITLKKGKMKIVTGLSTTRKKRV